MCARWYESVCTLQRCIFLIYSHWRWHIFIHTLNWSYFPNFTVLQPSYLFGIAFSSYKISAFFCATYVVFRPLWMWIQILWRVCVCVWCVREYKRKIEQWNGKRMSVVVKQTVTTSSYRLEKVSQVKAKTKREKNNFPNRRKSNLFLPGKWTRKTVNGSIKSVCDANEAHAISFSLALACSLARSLSCTSIYTYTYTYTQSANFISRKRRRRWMPHTRAHALAPTPPSLPNGNTGFNTGNYTTVIWALWQLPNDIE